MRIISRVSAISALAILGCFSACTSVLGIEEAQEPNETICRPFVCKDGTCGYQPKEKDASCGPLKYCDGNGACKGVFEAPCTADDECLSGLCTSGICKAGTLVPCGKPEDCASLVCIDGLCRLDLLDGCTTDEECKYNICIDGACRLLDGSPCANSEECSSRLCVDTICLRSDGAKCDSSAECASGECLGGICQVSVGHACTKNDECGSGSCVGKLCTGRSCVQLPKNCGPSNASCCESEIVASESYDRNHHTIYPDSTATASQYSLDKFEVTVGRFRKFVDVYPASKPAEGSGQHKNIVGSAWKNAWNASLPNTRADLVASLKNCTNLNPGLATPRPTWTDTPLGNENLPINCVNWYLAFAFCAWDGGRLPTEAEWAMAAGGGNLERKFPWSGDTIDSSYLTYNCEGNGTPLICDLADIHKVGSKSIKGDGRWGQSDLAGSVFEWVLDGHSGTYPSPCNDCAELTITAQRARRGGGWRSTDLNVTTSSRRGDTPETNDDMAGIRCARDL